MAGHDSTPTRLAEANAVTVRITVIAERPTLRIRVDGRLTTDAVGELEELIGSDPGATCLELADLRSADAAGLAALRRLRAEGIALYGVPRHLAWRIERQES
jgi:ABC-type transporter Mla MlaB component